MKNIIENLSKFIASRAFYLLLGMLVSFIVITAGVYLVQAVTGEAPSLSPADTWDTVNDGVDPGNFLTDELWNGLVNRVGSLAAGSGGWTYDSDWTNVTVNSGGAKGTGFYNDMQVNKFSHGLGSSIVDVVVFCKSRSYDKTKIISGQMGNFNADGTYNSIEWDDSEIYVWLEEYIIFYPADVYGSFNFDACEQIRVFAR